MAGVLIQHYVIKFVSDLGQVGGHFFFLFMVFNATFNNISVMLWWSFILEETGVPAENHQPVLSH
jgi:hypothetical protein